MTLSKPRNEKEYVNALETCLRAAKRMRPLVDSLLRLARADAGRLELKLEAVDLSHLAEGCAAMVKPLADERGVTVILDLQPVALEADSFRITQLIGNLLTNAILYNHKGGSATVTIRPEPNEAVITVSDTGLGIAKENLPKIFERFYRIEESRSRELGGAGLGLAICQSIVTAHGGTISATSEPNHGSMFTVRLPIKV